MSSYFINHHHSIRLPSLLSAKFVFSDNCEKGKKLLWFSSHSWKLGKKEVLLVVSADVRFLVIGSKLITSYTIKSSTEPETWHTTSNITLTRYHMVLQRHVYLDSDVVIRVSSCNIEKDGKQWQDGSFDEKHALRPHNHQCQYSH